MAADVFLWEFTWCMAGERRRSKIGHLVRGMSLLDADWSMGTRLGFLPLASDTIYLKALSRCHSSQWNTGFSFTVDPYGFRFRFRSGGPIKPAE